MHLCCEPVQARPVQVERAKATMASDAASGALRLSLAPAATREEELFQAFCELDHDRSGKLDPAELRGALKGVGLQMGSEQAQGLTLTLTLALALALALTLTLTLTLTRRRGSSPSTTGTGAA